MSGTERNNVELTPKDALVIVDLQNDFLPGGALAVSGGDEIIPVLNQYIASFEQRGLPIFLTRDWHPADHCSFREHGGIWPVHCVAGTDGAAFSAELRAAPAAAIISKATTSAAESYSGFDQTELEAMFRAAGVSRLFIGGLATDYCVFSTVRDALTRGFQVFLLQDAIRGVNVEPNDSLEAEQEMIRLGAIPIQLHNLSV